MNMKTVVIAFLLSLGCLPAAEQPLSRILFGSCIKQDRPAPILKTIVAERPEMFIFLGDNIYGDTADMKVLQGKYERLAGLPGFAELKNGSRVLATWDDHDYGVNDGGADYPMRRQSQAVFLDFWGDGADSLRRGRDGVYDAAVYGPVGKRVQVILLDTRFFRGPLKRGDRRVGGPYYPDPNPALSMLGDAQWKWLEREFKKPAELRIVATSIQCIPEASGQETWANMPRERNRFFRLIADSKANGVVLLSGDRHWAEVSVLTEDLPYPIYEFTSSSLNQLHGRGTPTDNRHRAIPTSFHKENYGRMLIDWDAEDPRVTTSVIDGAGQVRISKTLFLSELGR